MQRSLELQGILKADQKDRAWQATGKLPSETTMERMVRHDLQRRRRIGEIFGEGCLRTAADFRAAFSVFQHGNEPGQYFQAFLWAREAAQLGDSRMKPEIAEAIDRYLVSVGKKQLFGTQAFLKKVGGCWCLQPIEDQFPQELRDEYRGGPNAAFTGLAYLRFLNRGTACAENFCAPDLQATPRGTVPGFW